MLLLKKLKTKESPIDEYFASNFGKPTKQILAKIKPGLSDWVAKFIKKSPFLIMATVNGSGQTKASPRGGDPGFVQVLLYKKNCLFLPDITGNNLFESYRNLFDNPSISLCFMIPGVQEIARVNGSARIWNRKSSLGIAELNNVNTKVKQGLLIKVHESYHHCPRTLNRANLWHVATIEHHCQQRPIPERPWPPTNN